MTFQKGNKFSLGLTNNGRPPKFDTEDQLKDKVNAFFKHCIDNKEKPTITGLALFLGFESRSSLDDYCGRTRDFSYIIKRAKLAVENSYEQHGQSVDIFALKNMGWIDKQDFGIYENLFNDPEYLKKAKDRFKDSK